MIAQFRMLVSVLFLFGFAVSPSAENVRVNLEEPKDAALYSGISNLRGWAVAESGIAAIEIDIDGTYAFNCPWAERAAMWRMPIPITPIQTCPVLHGIQLQGVGIG